MQNKLIRNVLPGFVPAHEVLQHGAFTSTLATDNGDLRQVQIAALADGTESIVEAVHQRNELLHAPVPHAP